jgi:hypothetical protein
MTLQEWQYVAARLQQSKAALLQYMAADGDNDALQAAYQQLHAAGRIWRLLRPENGTLATGAVNANDVAEVPQDGVHLEQQGAE